MSSAHQYTLRVTAGSEYDAHEDVLVNTSEPIHISTAQIDLYLFVRVQNFRAPESSKLPTTCQYFDAPSRHGTLYSIGFTLIPKEDLPSDDLLLGNDFDEPIKQYLPPLFSTGLHIIKTVIDPGIEGDPYGEKPYLYGPLASSINVMRICGKSIDETGKPKDEVVEEGALGEDAKKVREDLHLPSTAKARQSFFLNEEKRKHFVLEKGRKYDFDFFNGFLDFNGMMMM